MVAFCLEQFEKERGQFVEKLIGMSRYVGELETQLLQLGGALSATSCFTTEEEDGSFQRLKPTTPILMKRNTPSLLPIVATCLLAAALTSAAPCSAKEKAGAAETVTAHVYTAKETANFKALAKETIAALSAGRNTEMVAKLTDLETAWDAKEKVLKPKNQDTWTLLDKTLDKAISALRSSKTNIPKGKAALEELLKMLDQATKP